jgi:hypothetical protein
MWEKGRKVDRLIRKPDIVARELDDSLFLVGGDNDAVFHLNAIGAAIWKLLADPISETETIEILTEAFPDMPAEQVGKDVSRLFHDLSGRGFITNAN